MSAGIIVPLNETGPSVVDSQSSSDLPMGALWIAAGRIISVLFGGTSSTGVPESSEIFSAISGWTTDGWSDSGAITKTPSVITAVARADTISSNILTTAQTVRHLHDTSGLTWEQLSKLLGVSRRALHLWASGGTMSAGHEAILRRIVAIIDKLPATNQTQRRAAILAPRGNGRSLYDLLRSERAGAERITGSPFSFEQLIGASDDETT